MTERRLGRKWLFLETARRSRPSIAFLGSQFSYSLYDHSQRNLHAHLPINYAHYATSSPIWMASTLATKNVLNLSNDRYLCEMVFFTALSISAYVSVNPSG